MIFLLCFSLAIRIRCLATIFAAPPLTQTTPWPRSLPLGPLRRPAPGAAPREPGGSQAGARLGLRAANAVLSAGGRGPPAAWEPGRAGERGWSAGGQQARKRLATPPPPGAWSERGRNETSGPRNPSARTTSVRLPTSALGELRPAEVRAPPAEGGEGG